MARVKILKVKRHKVDAGDLAGAALAGDTEGVAVILDDALEFQGMAGGLLERVDGPVFEELGALVVELVDKAIEQDRRGR